MQHLRNFACHELRSSKAVLLCNYFIQLQVHTWNCNLNISLIYLEVVHNACVESPTSNTWRKKQIIKAYFFRSTIPQSSTYLLRAIGGTCWCKTEDGGRCEQFRKGTHRKSSEPCSRWIWVRKTSEACLDGTSNSNALSGRVSFYRIRK